MTSQVVTAILLSVSTFALTAVTAHAHGGGLDEHGCHHDRKNGGYHCYQGAFAGLTFASKQDMLSTLETQNQQPKDLPLPFMVQSPRQLDGHSELRKTLRTAL